MLAAYCEQQIKFSDWSSLIQAFAVESLFAHMNGSLKALASLYESLQLVDTY